MAAPIADAWEAAVEVTAAAYRVDPAILKAASRGRGPKPPGHAIEAKKVAVYLAVVLAGCGYADLARHIGYHRDTVCSHCAEMRAAANDDEIEQRFEELRGAALVRLSVGSVAAPSAMFHEVGTRALILSMHAQLAEALGLLRALSVGQLSVHPTKEADHENVIKFPGTAG